VDLAGPAVLPVDAADLPGENEGYVGPAGGRDVARAVLFPEREQAVPLGLELLSQPGKPRGMGAVAGADHRDALELRPSPDALGRHVLARGAGVFEWTCRSAMKGMADYSITGRRRTGFWLC